MANCLLAPINWVAMDGVSFSGGDWSATLPAENLATTDPLAVARTTSAADDDTTVTAALGADRLWDTVFVPWGNQTPDAQWRVTSSGGHDSGLMPFYPVTHAPIGGYLPYGRPSADGKMPEDERDPRGVSMLYTIDTPEVADEITISVVDEANPAGFWQAAGLWIAKAERPAVNIRNGFTLGTVEESTVRRSLGGTVLGRRLWRRRRLAGAFQHQHRDVALAQWLEAQRMTGRVRPVLFSILTDMGIHQDRTTILGHFDQVTDLEHAKFRHYGWPFAITEA